MCGRYDLNQSPQMLALYFMLGSEPASFSNPDVRPTDMAPIIRVQAGRRIAIPARWGLIPSWAKDETIAHHTFNARAETLAERPAFRTAFRRQRCIVPVAAFFEWRAIPGQRKKQKLRFASPDQNPLAIAGLWDRWQRPGTGELIDSFTVITTQANSFMAPVHERMPAILGRSDWAAWLDPETYNPPLLLSMLQPCPNDWLECIEAQ